MCAIFTLWLDADVTRGPSWRIAVLSGDEFCSRAGLAVEREEVGEGNAKDSDELRVFRASWLGHDDGVNDFSVMPRRSRVQSTKASCLLGGAVIASRFVTW